MDIFARSRYSDYMLAVLRIVAGVVFISYGTMKLFGYPPGPMPPPPLMSQLGLAGMLEVFGGVLIVQGLFTRPVAFVLAGEMAVAYFQAHAPQSIFPSVNMGVPAVLYCFLFLYLSFAGPGAWSIDGFIARSRRRRAVDETTERHPPDQRHAA